MLGDLPKERDIPVRIFSEIVRMPPEVIKALVHGGIGHCIFYPAQTQAIENR